MMMKSFVPQYLVNLRKIVSNGLKWGERTALENLSVNLQELIEKTGRSDDKGDRI